MGFPKTTSNERIMTRLKEGDKAPDFCFDTPWETGREFHAGSAGKPSVLLFLRYIGCPVCGMEMAAYRRHIGLIEGKGARLFVILQSPAATIADGTGRQEWPYTVVCDPQGLIFRQYGVAAGGLLRYLHPAGLTAAVKATLKGFRHGKFEGRETQLPAVFIVAPDGSIQYAHYGAHVADVPAPAVVASHLAPGP